MVSDRRRPRRKEDQMTQEWQIEGPKVLDIGDENERVGKLRLGLVAGRVDIVTHDDSPTARLEVHDVKGRPLLVTWDGWTLKVTHVKEKDGSIWDSLTSFTQDKGKRRARISISVPATTQVKRQHRQRGGPDQRNPRQGQGQHCLWIADPRRHRRGRRRQHGHGRDRVPGP